VLDPNAILIILTMDAEAILPTLERYVKESNIRTEEDSQPILNLTALVAQTTTTAPTRPLSEYDATALGERFLSIQGLEEATRTSDGKSQISQLVGPIVAKNIIDFWEDEWIA
jgi:hypothetical protein